MPNSERDPYRPRQGSYRSYLLRMWREGERWFFILEPVVCEGPRQSFPTLRALTTFLEERMKDADGEEEKEEPSMWD
jgi:hypothetical protein